jgi:hypothetical protein
MHIIQNRSTTTRAASCGRRVLCEAQAAWLPSVQSWYVLVVTARQVAPLLIFAPQAISPARTRKAFYSVHKLSVLHSTRQSAHFLAKRNVTT